MVCGIYRITNNINGKSYIGASKNIKKRWDDHKYNRRNRMNPIIRKYGLDNFAFEIIEECFIGELSDKEQHYIKFYNTEAPNGYNLTKGGEINYNKTGFFHVAKKHMPSGNITYTYYFMRDGKKCWVSSLLIDELEKKVKSKGLYWSIIDEEKAKQTILETEKKKQLHVHLKKQDNNSGYYRVSRVNNPETNMGYIWKYTCKVNGKPIQIGSVDLDVLKIKVEKRGFLWFITDKEKAIASDKLNQLNKNKVTPYNKTGFYRVSVSKGSYRYRYFDESKKRKAITSMDIFELEKKVKSKGLPWKIIDEELAKKTLNEGEE